MLTDLQIFLIAETAYSLALNLVFLLLFIRRVLKLDKMGDNLEIAMPRSTWVKLGLLVAAIFLCAAHIVLSFSKDDYWLHFSPDFSLVALAFIANYTLQLYIVLREVRKSLLRYRYNALFWLLSSIAWLIEVIFVEVFRVNPTASTTLQIVLCLVNGALALIAILFEKIGRESDRSVREALNRPSDIRTAQSSFTRSHRHTDFNHFFVDFNRQFQVKEQKTGLMYTFKFAVYLDEQITVISRTEKNFCQLQKQLLKAFPQNPTVEMPPLRGTQGSIMQMGEQRLKRCEGYLIDLLRSEQFYVPCLLEFLQVPMNMRGRLLEEHKGMFHKQQTLYSEEDDGTRVPFFKVILQPDRILISNPDVLELQIKKRHRQIMEFHNQLLEQKRLNMELLSDGFPVTEAVHFFEIIVNRKQLWRAFASWMGLGSQLQNKIAAYFDLWTFGFRNVNIEVIGNEKNFDKEGRIITQYLISIQRKVPRGNRNECVVLKKRYSDFYSLNREVIKFINKNQLSAERLPDMPPKVSPFGSKTSPKSRQIRFDLYIRELVRIQGINHCVKLLQFLEVDAPSQPQVYEPQPDQAPQFFQNSERSYFSDLSSHRNSAYSRRQ